VAQTVESFDKGLMPLARIPLKVAAHEVGHAVACFVANEWPDLMDRIEVTGIETDIVHSGHLVSLSNLSGLQRTEHRERAVCFDIITFLAGVVAYARLAGGCFGVRWVVNQWPLVLQEQARTLPDVDEWVQRAAEGERVEDEHHIIWRLRWLQCDDMAAEVRRLLLMTAWVIEVEWPGIAAMARVLREKRSMSGEEFEAAWRAVRPREAVRRRRERRATERCGFIPPPGGCGGDRPKPP
jgi:hypothetical protein